MEITKWLYRPNIMASIQAIGARYNDSGIWCVQSGTARKSGPEEIIRQVFIAVLMHDFNIGPTNMSLEHPIQMGSSTKRADLVLTDLDKRPRAIVEFKARHSKTGLDQLKSYLHATSVEYGALVTSETLTLIVHHRGGRHQFLTLSSLEEWIAGLAIAKGNGREHLNQFKQLTPEQILSAMMRGLNTQDETSDQEKLISLLKQKIDALNHMHNNHELSNLNELNSLEEKIVQLESSTSNTIGTFQKFSEGQSEEQRFGPHSLTPVNQQVSVLIQELRLSIVRKRQQSVMVSILNEKITIAMSSFEVFKRFHVELRREGIIIPSTVTEEVWEKVIERLYVDFSSLPPEKQNTGLMEDTRKVLLNIPKKGIKSSDLTRKTQSLSRERRVKALDTLIALGKIKQEEIRPKKGRPSTVYFKI